MKNLISLFGVVGLTTAGITPLLNNTEIFNAEYSNKYEIDFAKALSTHAGSSSATQNHEWWTFKVDFNPKEVKEIKWSSSATDTLRWGWSYYYDTGGTLSNIPSNTFTNNLQNWKITSKQQAASAATYNFNNQYIKAFAAQYEGSARVGFTYYYENGSYYMQVALAVLAELRLSFSTADHTITTGSGFTLFL
ncbi:hypothetical protein [Spiroplasma chrysopicola]|uniref:Uncharacterized protein n=1 Tax=Spiroplasma chrysopicola DF-1 TaxID=1276227 RepID=R4UI76_9MOLU|nr:hypothetical protein [Spiroplasma chrysopicola]AGM25016.1 hypothetical protein SCHRY_v1c04350 [Spiroplasma chrysopicola DF-1]